MFHFLAGLYCARNTHCHSPVIGQIAARRSAIVLVTNLCWLRKDFAFKGRRTLAWHESMPPHIMPLHGYTSCWTTQRKAKQVEVRSLPSAIYELVVNTKYVHSSPVTLRHGGHACNNPQHFPTPALTLSTSHLPSPSPPSPSTPRVSPPASAAKPTGDAKNVSEHLDANVRR